MSTQKVSLGTVLEAKAEVLASVLHKEDVAQRDLWDTWNRIIAQQLNAKDPITEVFLAADSFSYVIGCVQFIQAIDPVANHKEVLEGKIGTCCGTTIWTEAYRPPYNRVLNDGDILLCTASDKWIHLSIKDKGTDKETEMNINLSTHTHSATPSVEQNKFVLNDETRQVAYAFLKANPGYSIENSGDPISTIIGVMGVNCVKDKDPVTEIVLSSHMYNSFLASKELIECLEPVNTIREMMEGKVGHLFGSTVFTEAYSHPVDQTMGPKDILFHTQSDKWFRVYVKETPSANV